MTFGVGNIISVEKKTNESVLRQDKTFNQVLVLKKHF